MSRPFASRDLTRMTLAVLGIGLLIAATFWVIRPFLGPLLWAAMIVVATWPIMRAAQGALGGRRAPAVAAMTAALVLVLVVPLYVGISAILDQSNRIVALLTSLPSLRVPPPPGWIATLPVAGSDLDAKWRELAALEPNALAHRATPYIVEGVRWFASQAGSFGAVVLNFLLTVIIAAVLYANGEEAAEYLHAFFRRLAGERGAALVVLAGKAIRAVALGVVVTAMVQSALAGMGLAAVGIPYTLVITAVVFLLCIAQIGAVVVLAPIVIWLYASGAPGRATVLLVFTIVATTVDSVLRPYLIKKGADLPLLLVFTGVIGGLLWLGIVGLFVGPVVLAVTSTLLKAWISDPEQPALAATPIPSPSVQPEGGPPARPSTGSGL